MQPNKFLFKGKHSFKFKNKKKNHEKPEIDAEDSTKFEEQENELRELVS